MPRSTGGGAVVARPPIGHQTAMGAIRRSLCRCALGALLAAASFAAVAQDEPICADRPGKANATCTAPAGHFQVETGLISWSHDRAGGVRTDDLALGITAIKLGLTDASHVELDLAPYAWSRSGGESVHGFGDIALRYKQRLTADDARVEIAINPVVKLPTASRRIGNGKVEGGGAVPIGYALSDTVGLTLGPELDLVADAGGHGRHLALVNVVSLSAPLLPRVGISGEIWNAMDFDPSGTTRSWSGDVSLAWLVTDALQLDAGINLGLSRSTPDVEIYTGISRRFR